MTKALSDVRVLDLSRVLAGPWATQMLGDLGAEIIKIERPGSGDDTRGWGPPWVGEGEDRTAAYYLTCNRNKKSVAIDMATTEGQQLIRDLAAQSDIVVENFKVGGLAKYGLDYESLKAINPRLIYCSITGFGQTGPDAQNPGYDMMIQAKSGFMSITGEPDGEPQRMGVALVDIMTGINSCSAILAALHDRGRTGVGQHIDMALFDVAMSSLGNQALNYLASGTAPMRSGNVHPNVMVSQPFETADGWVMVITGNDRQFARLANVIGLPEMAEDERYMTNGARSENRDTMIPKLSGALQLQTTAHWTKALTEVSIPNSPINTIDQAFAEPQAQYRGLSHEIDGLPQVASPLRLGASATDDATAPPAIGQDTDTVLSENLDLSVGQRAALRKSGAIG